MKIDMKQWIFNWIRYNVETKKLAGISFGIGEGMKKW